MPHEEINKLMWELCKRNAALFAMPLFCSDQDAMHRREKVKAFALLYWPAQGTNKAEETRLFLLAAYTLDEAMQTLSNEIPEISGYTLKKWVSLPFDKLFPVLRKFQDNKKISDRSDIEAGKTSDRSEVGGGPEARMEQFVNSLWLLLDQAAPTKTEKKTVTRLIEKLQQKYGATRQNT